MNGSRMKPSQDEWQAHKERLERLYLDKKMPLSQLMALMKEEFDFVATKNQYTMHFKAWGFRKNLKKEDWQKIDGNGTTSLFLNGRMIPAERLHRSTTRYRLPNYQICPSRQLPAGVTMHSSILRDIPSWTINLPFRCLETSLRQTLSSQGNRYATQIDQSELLRSLHPGREILSGFSMVISRLDSFEEAQPIVHIPSSSMPTLGATEAPLNALRSVVPISIVRELSPGTQTSVLHRQVLFSLANNFAGLGSFSVEQVIRYLRQETSDTLYKIFISNTQHSSRAVAQNLFKGAIEAGDEYIVNALLSRESIGVDPNNQVILVQGQRYTPIERASALQHKGVIKILLQHGVDVNKTLSGVAGSPWPPICGALDRALRFDPRFKHVDTEIVEMLLEAGGNVDSETLHDLIHRQEGQCAIAIMDRHAYTCHGIRSNTGIFTNAIKNLDEKLLPIVLDIMLKAGVDLNFNDHTLGHAGRPIDAAAERGNIGLFKTLLNHGANLSSETLYYSIRSGNEDLVQFLLEKDMDVSSFGPRAKTPLSRAIELQHLHIINLLVQNGALSRIRDQLLHRSALEEAAIVGNIDFIRMFARLGGKISPWILGIALSFSIKEGRYKDAKELIDDGADLNGHSYQGRWNNPLVEALWQKNAEMVELLLDADADPTRDTGGLSLRALPIKVAAEWGDHSMIQTLVSAGAKITPEAFSAAVRHKDRTLLDILLSRGDETDLLRGDALFVAVESGDISLTQSLLDRGAEPADSCALEKAATSQENGIFDLLLERYRAKYPRGRRGYGSSLLSGTIRSGDECAVMRLLAAGLDPNTEVFREPPEIALTPFGYAISFQQNNRTRIVEAFLEAGCDPNGMVSEVYWPPGFGGSRLVRLRTTAFLEAVATGDAEVVELLIRYKGKVDLAARYGIKRTPLQRAAEIGSVKIVELLLNHGVNSDEPTAARGGATALQLAAIGGHIPIACMLISRNADVNAPASKVDGRTALEGAAEHGRLDMVQFLLNAGAASKGEDRAQIRSSIKLAKRNGHFALCDLLEPLAAEPEMGEVTYPGHGDDQDFVDWSLCGPDAI